MIKTKRPLKIDSEVVVNIDVNAGVFPVEVFMASRCGAMQRVPVSYLLKPPSLHVSSTCSVKIARNAYLKIWIIHVKSKAFLRLEKSW